MLQSALDEVFNQQTNTQWLQNGTWPTLGEAIDEKKRTFVIVREDGPVRLDRSKSYIPEIQIKDGKTTNTIQGEKAITVLSTFKSM